jgi:ABC-type antimicrobial peptide transport system permease subunit
MPTPSFFWGFFVMDSYKFHYFAVWTEKVEGIQVVFTRVLQILGCFVVVNRGEVWWIAW